VVVTSKPRFVHCAAILAGELSATVLLCQLSYTARRLWQDSNLHPSKEPSHITTGETRLTLALQVTHVTNHSKSRDDLNVVLNQSETVIKVAIGEWAFRSQRGVFDPSRDHHRPAQAGEVVGVC
jgi:hypothetical protein